MLFNSFDYLLVFFPLVTIGYFLLPYKQRWWWLLAASCWFYMAFVPVYILILGFTIAVDYAAGILIDGSEGKKRKAWLVASVVANVGVLAFFKYFNFLNQSIAAVVRGMGLTYDVPDLGILLPIGLSFHTFQSLSYTIEVYRRHQKPERNPGVFALYVMFYPQLVAGPIERPGNLLNQLGMRFDPQYDKIAHGLRQMAWGFIKKLVIADRCGAIVDMVYTRWSKVAKFSPVSRETFRKLAKEGRAPKPERLGIRCTYYDNAELHKWLADPINYRAGV